LSFIENIQHLDQQLLIFLNNLGSHNWDSFWLIITNKTTWVPLYIFILVLLFKYFDWKKTLIIILFVALLITFTDQFVNLIKNYFERIRPLHDETIAGLIRFVKKSGGFSFLSGHATNSFAVSTFAILLLKPYFKKIYLVLFWPFLFSYSRIYLGLHYPSDVLCGAFLGILIGWIFFKVFQLLLTKFYPTN